LFDETKENYSPMVHYMVGEILEPVMMKMARLMKFKKPSVCNALNETTAYAYDQEIIKNHSEYGYGSICLLVMP
jgi:hypothetical protein